jgi:hypothetical protein
LPIQQLFGESGCQVPFNVTFAINHNWSQPEGPNRQVSFRKVLSIVNGKRTFTWFFESRESASTRLLLKDDEALKYFMNKSYWKSAIWDTARGTLVLQGLLGSFSDFARLFGDKS